MYQQATRQRLCGEELVICHWSWETGGSKDGIVIGKKCCKNYVVSTCTRNGKCKFWKKGVEGSRCPKFSWPLGWNGFDARQLRILYRISILRAQNLTSVPSFNRSFRSTQATKKASLQPSFASQTSVTVSSIKWLYTARLLWTAK